MKLRLRIHRIAVTLVASLVTIGATTWAGARDGANIAEHANGSAEAREEFLRNRVDLTLTILHNNDGESQLVDLGGELADFGGVARFASVVEDLREAAEGDCRRFFRGTSICRRWNRRAGAILLSSGDNFLSGPELNASLENGVPFFDSMALDRIGYDAIALGNHEFDLGPDTLADFIIGFANPPSFVSANLDFSNEPRLDDLAEDGILVGSTVVWVGGRRVGIVGATTEELDFISSPRDTIINEVADAVQHEIDRLRYHRWISRIILVSHLQGINEDLALIPNLNGVDVAIAGGGDELLANEGDLLVPGDEEQVFGPYPLTAMDARGREVPVVTTSGAYAYVGRLTVKFNIWGRVIGIDAEKSGPVRVAGGDHPDAVDPDPVIQATVVEPVAAAVAALETNVIAQTEVALEARRPQIRVQETNEGNLIADALLWQANLLAAEFGVAPADVGIQNGGGIRNASLIPAGPITELDTFDILPFLNFVTIIPDIPREQFKEILENAVSRVEDVSGRFAHLAGCTFVWDAAGQAQVLNEDGTVATPGSRVREVVLTDGTPIVQGGVVVAGPRLGVATIDFLARGGDQYPYRNAAFTSVGVTYQQALENYVSEALGGVISATEYPEGGERRITRQN